MLALSVKSNGMSALLDDPVSPLQERPIRIADFPGKRAGVAASRPKVGRSLSAGTVLEGDIRERSKGDPALLQQLPLSGVASE